MAGETRVRKWPDPSEDRMFWNLGKGPALRFSRTLRKSRVEARLRNSQAWGTRMALLSAEGPHDSMW